MQSKPPIGKIKSGVRNWFNQFRVPSARWMLLVATLAAPRAFALNPAEKPADYIASRWDAEDGLPHNSIKQIFQTRDGYLWVGTQQGLARFDGLTFTIFTSHNTPGLPNDQITSFAETADGSLWIGTSFGLARYQNGRFTAYGQADGVKSKTGTVNAVCVAPDGSLWIGSQDGITRWVNGKFVNDIDTSAYNMIGLRTIFVDRQKAVWLAAGSEALRYQDGKFTRFGRAQGLPAQRLEMLREDAEGHLIAVTQNGLLRLEGERFVPFEQNGALSSLRTSTTLVDRAGNLWIGSVNGLDRCSAGQAVPYADHNGKKLGMVDALLEDREGCLWIGTSAGLCRLTDRRAYTMPMKDGIGGGLTLAVTQTRAGTVWASSWADGVSRLQDGVFTHYAPVAQLSQETVAVIYEAPDGAMWLGTRGSSLHRLKDTNVTTFVYQPGVVSSRPVTAMLADDDGTLLIGISKRGLLQLRDGQIVPVPEATNFAPETVWLLKRMSNGRLLMGTSKGLYERRADRTWQLAAVGGVPQPVVVRELTEEPDGTIWLATEGQALIRWKGGEARSYDTRVGMVDDTLYSVLDDNLGSLWVSSGRGIARIRKSEFAEIDSGAIPSLNCLTFGRADGLLSASCSGSGGPSAVRLADGRLMMATDQGVAVIDPHLLQVNSQPPPVMIESIVADDHPLPPGPVVSIPAGVNRLEIRYTALSLIAPQRLRFRYQLEGYDPGWVEAGHNRSALYTHLAPGSYTFRVLACNNDGVWNEAGATLSLTMLPQFYQTLWFRLAAIALLVAALASFVSLRLRQVNRRRRMLERMNAELDQRVVQRTAEVGKTNHELRESQALYHSLVDQMPAAVFRKDAEGRYVFVNSSFCRIMEMLPDQILGKTASELVAAMPATQANRRPVSDQLESQGKSYHDLIMQTGRQIIVEDEYQGSDGKRSFYHTVKSAVYGADGKIAGSQGILFDVTDSKAAEAALSYERDLLRSLLDNSPDQIYFKNAQSCFIKTSKAQAVNFGLQSADELVGKSDFDFFTEAHARPAFEDEQEIIRTGRPLIGRVEKEVWKDGRTTWVLTNKMPLRDKDGQVIGTFGISKNITALMQTEAELAYERDLLRTLLDNSPDSIFFKDTQSRLVNVSRSEAANLFRVALSRHHAAHPGEGAEQLPAHLASLDRFREYVIGKTDADTYGGERSGSFNQDEQEIMRTGRPLLGKIEQTVCPDGSSLWFMTTKVPWRNQNGEIIGTFGTSRDISDLKNAEAKVEETHKRLLESSRQAGMAEIATNVLHNIGNVLNSVNVSASLVVDSVKKSKAANLAKVSAMLREHEHDLGTFITSDAKGRQLPVYLGQLSEQLLADQETAVHELDLLVKNIEHIKDVVSMQQSYARVSGVKEIISLRDLVEDGLRMNIGALDRHRVEVIREFADVPPINVDKHRVLQILVNLIRNAKYACEESGRAERRLTVRLANGEGRVKISVADNGIGIPPENLTRIFNHGFTTRKDGHGFGLHSGALAAKEMGGSLAAQSDGIGNGATFTLDLPCSTNGGSNE
jgi:PAS domain S-box-containing protein